MDAVVAHVTGTATEGAASALAPGLTLPRVAVATIAWAVGAAYFFSVPVFGGFRLMSGDLGDWRLGVFLAEHWRMVFDGTASWPWRQPPYFAPAADSIAFTDPSFGLAIPYVALRWAGLDQFLSFQVTVIAYSYAGFLGFVALALRVGRVSLALATFGALGFAFSNMNLVKLVHPIYAPVSLLAVLALLYARALDALPASAGRANAVGVLGAALFGFLAFTCFQIAWYGALIVLAMAVVIVLALRPPLLAAVASAGPARLAGFVAIQAAAIAAALIPFAVAFAGAWAAGASRPYWEMLHFAPRPLDLLNLGSGNLMWGRVAMLTGRVTTPDFSDSERSLAQTPIATLAFLILLVWLWRNRRNQRMDFRTAAIVAGGVAVVVLAPLAIAIGNVSGWWLLRQVVPGANAIRTPYRVQLALALPLWLLLVVGADALRGALAVRLAGAGRALGGTVAAGFGLIAALILLEQVNLARLPPIDRVAEAARFARIAPAPPECRRFFITSDDPRSNIFHLHTDAMMLALRERLPLLNGYSGSGPADWRLHEIHAPDYMDRVAAWVRARGVGEGLCRLELSAGRWFGPAAVSFGAGP